MRVADFNVRVEAAIAVAERGNWRDLRTFFQFAGIDTRANQLVRSRLNDIKGGPPLISGG
jgi:hypothetical protein